MDSFDNLIAFFQKRWSLFDREGKYAARRSALHLQKFVKGLHGLQLPGYPPVSTNLTPLYNTGKLRDSVVAESNGLSWRVTTTQQRLAAIHEFGAYWKMTEKQRRYLFGVVFKNEKKAFMKKIGAKSPDGGYIRIPPRPLWRYAEQHQEGEVIGIFEKAMEVLFKD